MNIKEDGRLEIIEESRRFVEQNKGYKIMDTKRHYPSPRLSSEFTDCSLPMTFDQYSHCALGCLYCFAYFFKSNNPSFRSDLGSANIKGLKDALAGRPSDSRSKMMHRNFIEKKFLLHWGGLADPFCHFEHSNRMGLSLLHALGRHNYPTLFSFKGASIFEKDYRKVFGKYAKQQNFAFQVSLVTGSDKLAKDVEVGVPPPTYRLKAIKMLSDMGYWTILRLRPFIIGVTDEGLDDLLHRALEAGIRGVSVEFFAMDIRCTDGMRTRYNWLGKIMGIKNLHNYFKALSPSERGGYMRLNRLVKEEHIKKIYKFCIKHNLVFGCSDPDFKELNTSGSCCAMPDDFPDNRGLENWSRAQMTYHLKEARRLYHTTGEIKLLRFTEVYDDSQPFMDDTQCTNDHVFVTDICNVERYAHTYRTIAQRSWNNLRSPGNPRNYFHGKVLPVGLDDQGDYVFAYTPLEYEERWKNEGIDLTR